MSYIGAEPTTAAFPFDQFSGNGTTTAFTLTYAPASTTSIIVAISGVVQNPNLYSVVGTTITFSPAPPTGTNNISVLYLGLPVQIGTPIPGSRLELALGSAANPSLTFLGDTNTGIYSPTADTIAFSEGGVESMRIDASGNLLVGATSALGPAANRGNITVNGATDAILAFGNAASLAGYILQDSGGMTLFSSGATYQRFYTNNTERARIDSSGNLLVGDTAAGAGAERFLVKSAGTSSATAGVRVINSGGTELFFIRSDGAFRTGSASVSPYNNTTGSAANVWINTDGTLLRSTSSLKYKNNVQDATHGLAELLVLRPVTYEGKAESDAGKTFGGLIAEEVHDAGLTEFVQYAEDGTPDALAYGNMVSLCIKAIQELKAELDATKAEVALLKGAA